MCVLTTKPCKTCKHWKLNDNDKYDEIIFPYKDDDFNQCETEEEEKLLFGNLVRYCESPKLLFYQRPLASESCVLDGSQFVAKLLTGEDFGCINHED